MTALEERNSSTADREIVQSRVYDAPRELVFRAWTDPQHVARWWGPNGFTITTHSMDVRPGGEWRFVMHGPDGTDYPNHITYREVVRPERLAYAHGDGTREHFQVEITFEEEAERRTRVTMRSVFPTAEARDYVVRVVGAIEGGKQTMARLAEHLPSMRELVISRTFDAPRELVFRTWTEEEHLRNWWGPKDFTIAACTNDLRPGGVMHFCMRAADGFEMWAKWVYRQIDPPRRLEFLSSFCDPDRNTIRPPFGDDWPLEMLAVITFDEAGGKTTVTVNWSAYNASEAEQATFDANHDSMRGGWGGTFEVYSDYLNNL